jgi:hypothetical protein
MQPTFNCLGGVSEEGVGKGMLGHQGCGHLVPALHPRDAHHPRARGAAGQGRSRRHDGIARTVNAAHADSETRWPGLAPVEEVLGDNARLLDYLLFLRAHNQPNELRHAPSERRGAARSLAEYQGR